MIKNGLKPFNLLERNKKNKLISTMLFKLQKSIHDKRVQKIIIFTKEILKYLELYFYNLIQNDY